MECTANVRPGVQKRFVNFFGEHAFAAKLAQRFVLNPVSRGRDDAQLDVALFATGRKAARRWFSVRRQGVTAKFPRTVSCEPQRWFQKSAITCASVGWPP